MDSITLKSLLLEHKNRFLSEKELIKRDVFQKPDRILDSREIIFISGVRRCGKSSLLSLISEYLLENTEVNKNNILFVNFEDERFINFTVDDFEKLYQTYLEL